MKSLSFVIKMCKLESNYLELRRGWGEGTLHEQNVRKNGLSEEESS